MEEENILAIKSTEENLVIVDDKKFDGVVTDLALIEDEKPKRQHKRSTDHTVYMRRKKVLSLIMQGYSNQQVMDVICKEYDIGPHSVEMDIHFATKSLKKSYDLDTITIAQKHLSIYYQILQQSVQDGDGHSAMKALASIERITGLHKPDVAIQINNNANMDLSNYSMDEITKMLKELGDTDTNKS